MDILCEFWSNISTKNNDVAEINTRLHLLTQYVPKLKYISKTLRKVESGLKQ